MKSREKKLKKSNKKELKFREQIVIWKAEISLYRVIISRKKSKIFEIKSNNRTYIGKFRSLSYCTKVSDIPRHIRPKTIYIADHVSSSLVTWKEIKNFYTRGLVYWTLLKYFVTGNQWKNLQPFYQPSQNNTSVCILFPFGACDR